MYCLRCGKESRNEQVFCDNCLEIMEKRPVKPGTAVHIPEKAVTYPDRAYTIRRPLSPGEQLQKLRGVLRWMSVTILVLSVILILTAAMLVYTLATRSAPPAAGNLGRNYTSTGDHQP